MPWALLLSSFASDSNYYPVFENDRFKVIARFNPQYMTLLQPLIPSERYAIWHLALPLQQDILIGVVHGLDIRNNSLAKQELFLQQVLATLSYFEAQVGHTRSVVLGDFNSNPFDSPIAGATGMHAVISREIALSKPRSILSQTYPYFYNPMWSLYGDRSGQAPATYYYRGSDVHELYWHMLDQVLVRPSLVAAFDSDSLKIVAIAGNLHFTNPSGVPDDLRFSDHLPVIFQLDLQSDFSMEARIDRESLA